MIKIYIFKDDKFINGFQVKGHSRFAESGKDIVCSAVSAVTQMTVKGLDEVLGLKTNLTIEDGYLQVLLDENRLDAQVLMLTLEKTLEDIQNQYPKFVKMEVKKRCL